MNGRPEWAARRTCASRLALLLVVTGCTSLELETPGYTTTGGVSVRGDAAAYGADELDEAVRATIEEFRDRYDRGRASREAATANVVFIEASSYEVGGAEVAGHVDPPSTWIYVASGGASLADSAFVHELVHFLDLRIHRGTDETHETWRGRVYEGIDRVNAMLRERASDQKRAHGAH